MAQLNDISFYRGEAVSLTFTMTPTTDITGWTITLTIRVNANDAAVVLTKTPASLVTPAAGIFSFNLSSAETKILLGTYAYDIQRVDAASEATLSIGTLIVRQEVLYP